MRGQSAVEYLLVFSAVLIVFGVVTLGQMISPAKESARDTLRLSQARSAVDMIANAIDTVYANGPGAVKSVSFHMDGSWTLQLDNVKNKLRITVETSAGSKDLEANLRYEIDNHHSVAGIVAGAYTVIVEWPEGSRLEGIGGGKLADKKIFIYIRPRGR